MALDIPFPSGGLIEKRTSEGYQRSLLIPGSFDYKTWEDGFEGDQLRAEYPAAKTNGTSAARTFTEHSTNAFLDLISGTDDDGYAGTGFGLNWTGDRGVLFEAVIKLPAAITGMKFEIGLSDNDQDAGAALDTQATPMTVTASDVAVFVYDHDVNNGSDGNLDFVSAIGGTVTSTATVVAAPSASDTIRVAIRVETDSISAFVNGNQVAGGTHSLQGGSKITPWAFVQARAVSASRTLQLHKWRLIQPAY